MARRIFRLLLRLLPFDFRSDYGRELQRAYDDERRDASGHAGRLRVLGANAAALLAIGPREHLHQFRQDLSYALRGMRANPGFVAVALITLALGTGVNTAIFSIVHAVLLRPLPYAEPDSLVTVMNRYDGVAQLALSDPEYLDYSESSRALQIAAMSSGTVTITGGAGEPERVGSVTITTNTFDVLGRHPALGRGFLADEARSGTAVILSAAIWRDRFGGDPAIVGRSVTVQGEARTVVGVLPPDLVLPIDLASNRPAAVIVANTLDASAARHQRGGHYMVGVGRLQQGVTATAAAAELDGILTRLKQQYPDQHNQPNFGIAIHPLRDALLGDSRPVLLVLAGSVALVLLLACANVANLMLARGESRRRELALRAALGASRFRMARQLLTEALVLSVAAAGLGLLVARWVLSVVVAVGPDALPRLGEVSLNGTVLLFAAALAMATTILFALLPAAQLSRTPAGETLKEGSRGSSGARAHVRRALVVCQVSLAVVLLVGAGLLLKSFIRVLNVPTGFDPTDVVTARISAPAARYPALPEVSGYFSRAVAELAAIPGVTQAGASSGLPLAVASGDWSFDIEGRPRIDGRRPGATDWYVVTPGYFEALRIAAVRGRRPLPSDTAEAPPVVFINETAARTIFPGQDPVGSRIMLSRSRGLEQPWRTIAGVVADVRQRGLDRPARPELFIPHTQFLHFSRGQQARSMSIVVRGTVPPDRLVQSVRGALRRIDPEIPVADARAMVDVLALSVADRKLNVLLLGAFAVLAIVLATVGVYGVIAYDVLQRTREIGIRVALGATRRSVLSLMLAQGVKLVLTGAVIGLVVAALASRSMSQLLYDVGPRDLTVFGSVFAVLLLTGAAATALPSWRATRVDTLTALRTE